MKVIPHFTFEGTAQQALEFYQKSLNATPAALIRFEDAAECCTGMCEINDQNRHLIMHARLRVGDFMIDFCDQMPGQTPTIGSNIMINLTLTDHAEIEGIFNSLANGGTIMCPLQQTSWSPLFGIVTDKFGICWNVMHEE